MCDSHNHPRPFLTGEFTYDIDGETVAMKFEVLVCVHGDMGIAIRAANPSEKALWVVREDRDVMATLLMEAGRRAAKAFAPWRDKSQFN